MDIKIVKFLDGLESSKDFLTIGKLYAVWSKGESEGSYLIYDNEMELCEIFLGEYEIVKD